MTATKRTTKTRKTRTTTTRKRSARTPGAGASWGRSLARMLAGLARLVRALRTSSAGHRAPAGPAAGGTSRSRGRAPQGSTGSAGRPAARGRFGQPTGGVPPMPPGWEPERSAAHRRAFPVLNDEQRQALWAREWARQNGLDGPDEHTDPKTQTDATGEAA